jgi:hypothetical protein
MFTSGRLGINYIFSSLFNHINHGDMVALGFTVKIILCYSVSLCLGGSKSHLCSYKKETEYCVNHQRSEAL